MKIKIKVAHFALPKGSIFEAEDLGDKWLVVNHLLSNTTQIIDKCDAVKVNDIGNELAV